MVTDNPAPRVATCETCGRQVTAGARGPLPRRCSACRAAAHRDVDYRIATAVNAAVRAAAPATVVRPLRAAQRAAQEWTRFGE